MTTILLTAANGTIGRRLVSALSAAGSDVRRLQRDPDRIAEQFRGVDRLFLACPNGPDQVEFECAMIDYAVRAGVRRIVKLSARGADVDAAVAFWQWHALIEQHLRASGIASVVLQPSFMMSNLFAAADHVRDQGMLFAPAGEAKIGMVHPDDVADVALAALTGDGHEGRRYVLTGPTALGYADVAAAASRALGHPVGYADVPPEAAVAGMEQAGLPRFAAEQIGAVFAELRRGVQAETTDTVRTVTGREPRTLDAWFAEFADAFRRDPAPVG